MLSCKLPVMGVISPDAATHTLWKEVLIQKSHHCTSFTSGSKDFGSLVYNVNGSSCTLLSDRKLGSEGAGQRLNTNPETSWSWKLKSCKICLVSRCSNNRKISYRSIEFDFY